MSLTVPGGGEPTMAQQNFCTSSASGAGGAGAPLVKLEKDE